MTEQKSVVLIVDDSAPARETLTEALEAEGYELHQAGGGPEALERAAALKPDVILLDVMMPGMDGFEVCRRLRAAPDLAGVFFACYPAGLACIVTPAKKPTRCLWGSVDGDFRNTRRERDQATCGE